MTAGSATRATDYRKTLLVLLNNISLGDSLGPPEGP